MLAWVKGDLERERGLPISKFCDRNNIAGGVYNGMGQLYFYDFMYVRRTIWAYVMSNMEFYLYEFINVPNFSLLLCHFMERMTTP
jgi:hypothetical protein